jgi:hypothetical protein
MTKTKRKSTKPASPAQIAARKRFAQMAKSGAFKRKAKAARKKNSAQKIRAEHADVFIHNSRGFSGRAPDWTKNPLRFKSEKEYQAWKAKTGPAPQRKATKKAGGFKRTAKAIGRNIVRGLGMAHNPKHHFSTDSYVAISPFGIVKARGSAKQIRSLVKSKGKGWSSGLSLSAKIGSRFGGPGYVQHGSQGKGSKAKRRAAKYGLTFNPLGKHLPGLPAKYQRMYEHVLDSTGSKSIAAATVHKELSRQNPGLFSRLFGKAKAKVGYRKTQRGRRKVAAVGYRKTQKGRKRPTSYMERMSYKRGAATYHLSNPRRGTTSFYREKGGLREEGKYISGKGAKYTRRSSKREARERRILKAKGYGKHGLLKSYTRKRGYSSAPGRLAGPPLGTRLPNPSPASVFSEFRGKNATTKTKATAARGTPAVLAKLGGLQELHVRGKRLRFNGRASLAADGRKKLHIVGAKFARPNPPGEVDYGEILSVVYRADKPHIEAGTYDYKHHFGEDGGRKPHLVVDEEGYPIIEGGSYRITEDGIID